jgi:methionine-gamma-lyase
MAEGAPSDLPATWLLHGDAEARHGAVVPPIVQASTFAANSSEEFFDLATKDFSDEFYVRYGTPNHTQVAEVVARLEGAERAIVTASGMGAVTTLALALLQSGDHVIVQSSIYPGTNTLTTDLLARFGCRPTWWTKRPCMRFSRRSVPQHGLSLLRARVTLIWASLICESAPRLRIARVRCWSRTIPWQRR